MDKVKATLLLLLFASLTVNFCLGQQQQIQQVASSTEAGPEDANDWQEKLSQSLTTTTASSFDSLPEKSEALLPSSDGTGELPPTHLPPEVEPLKATESSFLPITEAAETQNLIEDLAPATTTSQLELLKPSEVVTTTSLPSLAVAPDSTAEGLIRNRKSSNSNSTEIQQQKRSNSNSTSTEASLADYLLAGGSERAANPLDYEDFDLDYQLKLTNNTNNSGGDFLNLSKRENEKVAGPNWTGLLRQQSHLFTPSNISSFLPVVEQAGRQGSSPNSEQTSDSAEGAMIPSLLTVKSTQLSSQELNKIRPHFLFYQDNYQDSQLGSQLIDSSQVYPANGDLLATASVGGSPSGPQILVLANSSSNIQEKPRNSSERQSIISLVNGSPVVRQSLLSSLIGNGGKQANLFTGSSRPTPSEEGLVTTIVVDNSTPTEAPVLTTTTPDLTKLYNATSGASNSSRTNPSPISRDNQWFNYPQPSLHQNPLLLHHILNKPANYVQQVGQQATVKKATFMTSSPSAINSPATTSSSPGGLMIIERPTLNEIEGSSVNKTQLQMQLNELKAFQERQQLAIGSTTPNIPSQFLSNNKEFGWQPSFNRNSPLPVDFMSHLIGSRTRVNFEQTPTNSRLPLLLPYNQPKETVDFRSNRFPFPTQTTGTNNAMHHLFGNNLSGHNLQHFNRTFQNFQGWPMKPEAFLQRPVFQPLPTQLPVLGGQPLLTASSLLHETYTPSLNSLHHHSSNKQTNVRDYLARQQHLQAPQNNKLEGKPERLNSGMQQSNMSEEDMSTYVAQLAAFNSLPANSPHPESSQEESSSRGMSSSASSVQLQAVDLSAPSPEVLLQLALEQLKQQNRSRLSFNRGQQSGSREPASKNWLELLKEAKLIGLSDEVQAQIYQEHLNPMLRVNQPTSEITPAKQAMQIQNRPPYSTLLSTTSAPEIKPASQLKTAGTDDTGSWTAPESSPYLNLEEHQKQLQRKQEQERLQQRRKQAAFVEALRESLARLQQQQKGNDSVDLSKIPSNSIAHATPDDFEEQASGGGVLPTSRKPIPDWLERQIIQESFLHESARVHPFGHSAKSTYIGRPYYGMPALRPVGLLRPASSHFQPSHLAAPRPLYPLPPQSRPYLRPLIPLRPLNSIALAETNAQKSFVAAGGGQLTGSNNLQTLPFAPLNPTKLLLDRFPMASAPAYLVKLPTLTGGTITASGSLIPPRLLRLNKGLFPVSAGPPPAPFGSFLSAAAAAGIPMVGSVGARLRLVGQNPANSGMQNLQQASSFLAPLHRPAPANLFRYPLMYSPSMQMTSSYPLQQAFGPSQLEPTQQFESIGSSQKVTQHPAATTSSQPEPKQAAPFAAPEVAPDSPLTRLQQATASLVELTGLASLVEEMVSGPDIESSPAAALASAINQLSAAHAQNAAMNAQATTSSSSTTGSAGAEQATGNQQQQLFSWKNMLNVPSGLWQREKALLNVKNRDSLERLLASAAAVGNRQRQPTTRLKVKYIKVPVAVYETTSGAGGDLNFLLPPRNQLVTKTQLAEIVTSNNLSEQHQGAAPSPAATPAGSPSNSLTGSGATSASSSQQSSQETPVTAAATSSSEFLFDELGSDSSPLANYLANNDLSESTETFELPLSSKVSGHKGYKKFFPLTRNQILQSSELLSPMESGFYYSMLAAPSNHNLQSSSLTKSVDNDDGEDKKRKKNRKTKKKKEEDEEEEEEEDDDLSFSKDDLPLLESIISTIVQPPPSPIQQQQASGSLQPGWLRGSRTMLSPFGEASSSGKVESFAVNPANQHSFNRHKLTIGELVGALGARRLISSLLNRKKSSGRVPISSISSRANRRRAVTQAPFGKKRAPETSRKFSKLRVGSYPVGGSIYEPVLKNPAQPSSAVSSKSTFNVTSSDETSRTTTTGPEVALSDSDGVQLNFASLKDVRGKEKTAEEEAFRGGKRKKMAMPLYHVVADHFSKLHSGPISLQKSISGQQKQAKPALIIGAEMNKKQQISLPEVK